MLVNEYYKFRKCEKMYTLSKQIVSDNHRPLILNGIISGICKILIESEKADIAEQKEKVLAFVKGELSQYQPEWFDYSWQLSRQQNMDYIVFARLLSFLQETLMRFSIVERAKKVCLAVGELSLETGAELILQEKAHPDSYIAVRISFSAHQKSLNGRSMRTNSSTDLNNMVLKAVLEETYPGIHIWDISVRNGDDTFEELGKEFTSGEAARHNLHHITYENYYTDGVFDRDGFESALHSAAMEKEKPSCYDCFCKDACKKAPQVARKQGEVVQTAYRMPQFNEQQQKVISFKEGCMSVLAGPGSGKTATLIGRTNSLIASGVESSFILLVTFSKEAAKELGTRAQAILPAWEQPKIATFHSLAYEVLVRNTKRFGRKFVLLADDERRALIEKMTKVYPRIRGLNYNLVDGERGVVAMLDNRILLYRTDKNAFHEKYPDLGTDFTTFAEDFIKVCERNGYIGFDEQITLATQYLKQDAELLKIYRNMYQYIMVDEFQDISREQAEFIYLLAGKEPNLVVVGDDDQNVYTFRGGSPKYLRSFNETFGGECVKLSENFRSDGAIVTAAAKVIAQNTDRVPKDIFSSKDNGKKPFLIPYDNADDRIKRIEECIRNALASGVALRNIAVLASKNSTLDELDKEMHSPRHLAKAYLVDDALFGYIYDVLCVLFKGKNKEQSAVRLFRYFQQEPDADFLMQKFPYLKRKLNAEKLVILLSDSIDAVDSLSYDDMLSFIKEWHIRSVEDLYRRMNYMMRFGDKKTRASVPEGEEVTLITCHDAKGREWDAVILADADEYKENSPEDVNLLYVASTRPKKLLYSLHKKGKSTMLDTVAQPLSI